VAARAFDGFYGLDRRLREWEQQEQSEDSSPKQ
jgi:hypothetical protein